MLAPRGATCARPELFFLEPRSGREMSDNSRETDLLDAAGAVQPAGRGVGTMGSSVTFAIAILGEEWRRVGGDVEVEGLGGELEARKEKIPAVSIRAV